MFLENHGELKLRAGFEPDYEIQEKMKDVMGWLGCGEWEKANASWSIKVHYVACCSHLVQPKLYELGLAINPNSEENTDFESLGKAQTFSRAESEQSSDFEFLMYSMTHALKDIPKEDFLDKAKFEALKEDPRIKAIISAALSQ